jgi:hypothetical protein
LAAFAFLFSYVSGAALAIVRYANHVPVANHAHAAFPGLLILLWKMQHPCCNIHLQVSNQFPFQQLPTLWHESSPMPSIMVDDGFTAHAGTWSKGSVISNWILTIHQPRFILQADSKTPIPPRGRYQTCLLKSLLNKSRYPEPHLQSTQPQMVPLLSTIQSFPLLKTFKPNQPSRHLYHFKFLSILS